MLSVLTGQVDCSVQTNINQHKYPRTNMQSFCAAMHLSTDLPPVAAKYCKALFEVPHHKTIIQHHVIQFSHTLKHKGHTEHTHKTNRTTARTRNPSAWGVFSSCGSSGHAIDLSILFLTSQHVCLPACPPVLAALFHQARPFNEPLYLPSADSLPRCFPYSMTHTDTHICTLTRVHISYTWTVHPEYTHMLWMYPSSERNRKLWKSFRAVKGCVWEEAFSSSSHSAALLLLCALALLSSSSSAPSPFICSFHIYCRNTTVMWGLHQRWIGGFRMAEGVRKGINCESSKSLICHPCPQGPLKRQRRHLK